MKYFICGFMGAGKTTMLRQLERELPQSFTFVDLDDYIFEKHGEGFKNLAELIESSGFDGFRALEFSSIMNLSQIDNLILSLGGGALSEQTIGLLSDWQGYWLRTDFKTCWSRISEDANRPLTKLGESKLSELYKDRELIYSQFSAISSLEELIANILI